MLLCLSAGWPARVYAQVPYMNEWYQFNQNYIKLLVVADGPHRV